MNGRTGTQAGVSGGLDHGRRGLTTVLFLLLALFPGAGAATAQSGPGSPDRPPPPTPNPAPVARGSAAASQVVVFPEGGGEPRRVSYLEIDGVPHLAVADVAGILRATTYWRPETRKLLLRVGEHRARLAIDNPFLVIDERRFRLDPPRYRQGRVWIPIGFFELASEAGLVGVVEWNSSDRVLTLGAPGYSVGALTLAEGGAFTQLSLEVLEGVRPRVVSASPRLFVVRVPRGVAPPSVRGTVHALGRFERVEVVQGEGGVDLFMQVSSGSRGYALRALTDPARIEVLVADRWGRDGALVFQPFAFEAEEEVALPGEEEPAGSRGLTPLIVLDPGHGGEDRGSVGSGGQEERHLTLELARRLQRRLQDAGYRVSLVRERDERVDVPRRVEMANGLRADLFLSLHCDLNGPLARGGYTLAVRSGGSQILYEDLSEVVPGQVTSADTRQVLSLVRWASAGNQHTLASLRAARAIDARLGERFPGARGGVGSYPVWALEGARMPAVMLEFGALDDRGSDDPGDAMKRGAFLDRLADAIADGVRDAVKGARSRS